MTVGCSNCDGTGWVCENHRNRPWADAPSTRADACACGAGAPCPKCNDPEPGELPDISGVIQDPKVTT
jgi:hypothetical protein